MNGFFQINTYYNEFKQEAGAAYTAAPTQQQNQQQHQHQQISVGDGGNDAKQSISQQRKNESSAKNQRRFLNETEEARAKRLARNAERMRQKRATESEEQSRKRMAENAERMRRKRAAETEEEYRTRMERSAEFKLTDEYRRRLTENAERNRRRRQNETELERSIRRARSAARERLRRAMETPDQRAMRLAKLAERMRITRDHLWRTIETPEQRAIRLEKLAERMRIARANETPEQRAMRLAKNAARARQRFLDESPEQWIERKRKKAEYARQKRAAAASLGANGAPSVASTTSSLQHHGSMQLHQQPSMDSSNFPGQAPTTLPETILHTSIPLATGSSSNSAAVPTFAMNVKDSNKPTNSTKTQQTTAVQMHPEQIYSPPQVIFNGTEFKPHELVNGQHLVMQPDLNCPSNLYKLHILPYPFASSTAAGVAHLDQSTEYKNK